MQLDEQSKHVFELWKVYGGQVVRQDPFRIKLVLSWHPVQKFGEVDVQNEQFPEQPQKVLFSLNLLVGHEATQIPSLKRYGTLHWIQLLEPEPEHV